MSEVCGCLCRQVPEVGWRSTGCGCSTRGKYTGLSRRPKPPHQTRSILRAYRSVPGHPARQVVVGATQSVGAATEIEERATIWEIPWPEPDVPIESWEDWQEYVQGLEGRVYQLPALPGGARSIAFGLNQSATVVGESGSSSGSRAVLWHGGIGHSGIITGPSVLDLNDRLPSGSSWVLTQARDINDRGEIVANGSQSELRRAFLLRPALETSPPPDFDFVKTAPATVAPDGTLHYAFTIYNSDPSGESHTFTIFDPLPTGTEYRPEDNTATGWSLQADGTTLTWTGDVAPPAREIPLWLRVTAPDGAVIENVGHRAKREDTGLERLGDREVTRVLNEPPHIALTYYVPCPFATESMFIRLMAEASDPDGSIDRVVFYSADQSEAASTDVSDPYEYIVDGPADGTYTFWAVAFDEHGGSAASNEVTIRLLDGASRLPTYRVEVLPLPEGAVGAAPLDINDSGAMVGQAWPTPTELRPCIWIDGSASFLSEERGAAMAINNLGVACGYIGEHAYDDSWECEAVIFTEPVQYIDPGGKSVAVDINDNGDVLAVSEVDWRVYHEGILQTPGSPGGAAEFGFFRLHQGVLNGAGQVALTVKVSQSEHNAYRYTPAGMPTPFVELGLADSHASAINELGHVVGSTSSATYHGGVLWTEGAPGFQLGVVSVQGFPSWDPVPWALTSNGTMIGEFGVNPRQSYIGLCNDMRPAHELVEPESESEWIYFFLHAINEHGVAVGMGSRRPSGEWAAVRLVPLVE